MESTDDFAVVPDTQGPHAPSSSGFLPPPGAQFHPGMAMADSTYLSHFTPKPFMFEAPGKRTAAAPPVVVVLSERL